MIVFCLAAISPNSVSKQTVWDFLECNEAVLQEYVRDKISKETVMKWLDDKSGESSVQSEVPLVAREMKLYAIKIFFNSNF